MYALAFNTNIQRIGGVMEILERSKVSVRHSDKPVGAEILGVDLSRELDAATFSMIERVFDENGMIFFRNQTLNPDAQIRFSRRFGELEQHVRQEYALPGYPEIHLISNVKEGERSIGSAYAGDAWHTDLCFMKQPSRCSLLYAMEVPVKDGKVLGSTEFASTQYAYDTLPDETKQKIGNLQGIQQYHRRQEIKRMQRMKDHARPALTAEQKALTPDITQPVVRTHPRSGRKCIYVNETYTFGIAGMTEDEAQPLLKSLSEHVTRPRYVYRHEWQVGDLIMWDNCSTQHRAITDYALPQRRLMHRTAIRGSVPF
jgi:taurine dioxygenase